MLVQEIEITANDGVVLRAQVYGPAGAPRIVMSHGNGLAIGGYKGYWSRLLDDYQVVVFDFRGHGASDTGTLQHHSWGQFDTDFSQVLKTLESRLGAQPTFGAFHSLSSLVCLRNIQRYGSNWAGLILFDPPLMPPDGHQWQQAHIDEMLSLGARVARRQSVFSSTDELAQQYRRSSMLSRWTPESYLFMAQSTLRRNAASGQWHLSCPPAFESKIFTSNDNQGLWQWLPAMRDSALKIKLLCADPGVPNVQSSAFTTPLVAEQGGFDYEFVPDTTHFLQLEAPEQCAALTHEFFQTLL